jgi:hypothetical protein
MPDIFTPHQKQKTHVSQADNKKQDKKSERASSPNPLNLEEHRTHSEKNGKLGFFTALCEYPKDLSFVNQDENEEVILFLRRHFLTNLPWIITSFIASFIPPLILFILSVTRIDFIAVPSGIVISLVLFYYLVLIGYIYTSFLAWFFNIGIVTQKRMVDLDYANILHKNIASVHLSEVVDTEFVQKGFFQSFFNYGDILIQTEGIKANFEFLASPKPAHVSDVIHEILTKTRGDAK